MKFRQNCILSYNYYLLQTYGKVKYFRKSFVTDSFSIPRLQQYEILETLCLSLFCLKSHVLQIILYRNTSRRPLPSSSSTQTYIILHLDVTSDLLSESTGTPRDLDFTG